jgi:hypothetical protein
MSESKEPDEVTQQSDPTDAANGAGKFILDVPKLGLVAAPDLMHHTESAVENIKPEDVSEGEKRLARASFFPMLVLTSSLLLFFCFSPSFCYCTLPACLPALLPILHRRSC